MRATFFIKALMSVALMLLFLSQEGGRAQVRVAWNQVSDRVVSVFADDEVVEGREIKSEKPSIAAALDEDVQEALNKLYELDVTPEDYSIKYDRDLWAPWTDLDGNCRNTRHDLLAKSSDVDVKTSADGCWVQQGLWWDPYTNRWFTESSDVDIDHVVAVAEAHKSGGAVWSPERKSQFYNDASIGNLIAVHDVANREKSASDASEWLPANTDVHCPYAEQWINVKLVWGLSVDEKEFHTLKDILLSCDASSMVLNKPVSN